MTAAGRIKPVMNEDNAWWWAKAQDGKLAIQRCRSCGELRHPPRPMCGECRSLEWDSIDAGGRGTVASFTILHHPQFPGYEYPLAIILVDLEEGTRFTSQLVDCAPENVWFGMPVELVMHDDPYGFRLPMFRPAGEAR